jgi:hypothetical protein
MTGHAFLAPSNAHVWVKCNLNPTMVRKYPKLDDEKTREGDAAHWVNHTLMQTGVMLPIGTQTPSGATVTKEMQDGAEVWRHAIGELSGRTLYYESHVRGGSIHKTENDGTPDLWEFTPGAPPLLTVFDYKFGRRLVDAFENWQGINYLSLIMDHLGVHNGVHDQMIAARIVIVQPRGYHPEGMIREWRIPHLSDLRASFNILRGAADRATSTGHIVGTVNEHCGDCPGRHACQSLQRNVLAGADIVASSLPLELPTEALGHELRTVRRLIKLAEARKTGLEEQARSEIMSGKRVPFSTMKESEPRERWKMPPEDIATIGAAFGVNLAKQEVLTPAQAREAGVPAELIDSLCERPRGELKVVEDDGRDLRKLFGK